MQNINGSTVKVYTSYVAFRLEMTCDNSVLNNPEISSQIYI